jgi:hypothetical protein
MVAEFLVDLMRRNMIHFDRQDREENFEELVGPAHFFQSPWPVVFGISAEAFSLF